MSKLIPKFLNSLIFIILGINLGLRALVLHKKETMQILKTLKEKVGGKN